MVIAYTNYVMVTASINAVDLLLTFQHAQLFIKCLKYSADLSLISDATCDSPTFKRNLAQDFIYSELVIYSFAHQSIILISTIWDFDTKAYLKLSYLIAW